MQKVDERKEEDIDAFCESVKSEIENLQKNESNLEELSAGIPCIFTVLTISTDSDEDSDTEFELEEGMDDEEELIEPEFDENLETNTEIVKDEGKSKEATEFLEIIHATYKEVYSKGKIVLWYFLLL